MSRRLLIKLGNKEKWQTNWTNLNVKLKSMMQLIEASKKKNRKLSKKPIEEREDNRAPEDDDDGLVKIPTQQTKA